MADNDETKMIPTVSRFISGTGGRFMCKWLVRKNKRHKGLGVNQGEALLDNEIFFFLGGREEKDGQERGKSKRDEGDGRREGMAKLKKGQLEEIQKEGTHREREREYI